MTPQALVAPTGYTRIPPASLPGGLARPETSRPGRWSADELAGVVAPRGLATFALRPLAGAVLVAEKTRFEPVGPPRGARMMGSGATLAGRSYTVPPANTAARSKNEPGPCLVEALA